VSKSLKLRVASHSLQNVQEIEFLITSRPITGNIPSTPINIAALKLPTSIELADTSFATPGKVDMLIGNEFFLKLLLSNKIQLEGGPMLQETKFGWMIGGSVDGHKTNQRSKPAFHDNASTDSQEASS
jgi:hypothetical protein